MIELIYMSVASRRMNKQDIADLLETSRRNNAATGITGVLLYGDTSHEFLQLLEGPELAIEHLMEAITVDDRHRGIDVMYRNQIESRSFDQWRMTFRGFSDLQGDGTGQWLESMSTRLQAHNTGHRAPNRALDLVLKLSKTI